MAYGFGTGVQAGLGATDYSNYLRGALTGAQAAARGNEMIAQGIQQVGQQINAMEQRYMQKKEKTEERMRDANKQIASARLLAKGIEGNSLFDESIRKVANDQLKVLNDPYASPDEKLATAGSVNETMGQLINMGVVSAQAADINARIARNNFANAVLDSYYGNRPTGGAAAPSQPTGYGAAEATFTEGPRGRSINIGPLEPLPQAQVQSGVVDPYARRDRGLAAAGGNPEAIKLVEQAFEQDLKTIVPQVSAAILQDIDAGGDGAEIPAGVPESVYNLAIQNPQVNAAIKEARTEKRANKIAEVVQGVGSGSDIDKAIATLPPVDQLEALKQIKETYPQRTMNIFEFGGARYIQIGGDIKPLNEKAGLNVDKFNEGLNLAAAVASEVGEEFVDFTDLTGDQQRKVTDAFFLSLEGGGRDSVGNNFYQDLGTFWQTALQSAKSKSESGSGKGGAGTKTSKTAPKQTDATLQPINQPTQGAGATPQAAQAQAQAAQPQAPVQQGSRNPFELNLPAGFPGTGTELNVTNVTVADSVPGQYSSAGITAPPIETSVPAPAKPEGIDAERITRDVINVTTGAELARRGVVKALKNPEVQRPLAYLRAALREAGASVNDAAKALGGQLGKTTLRRAGAIGFATVTIDDVLGKALTFVGNQSRKAEGKELRDYNTGAVELTMEKLGELSVDPRGEQIIKGRILDEIEAIQASRVGDRALDAEKNAQIRYLLELSQRINSVGFRSGEGKRFSR